MFDERDLGRGFLAVASRGGIAKGVAALAVIGVASLLMLAPFGGTGQPQAACLPLAPGQAEDPNPTGPLRATQIAFAKLIDEVAVQRGLPGKATLIALMTALVESDLQNLTYGDADSVGLFQQRPAAGWGTADQIMKIRSTRARPSSVVQRHARPAGPGRHRRLAVDGVSATPRRPSRSPHSLIAMHCVNKRLGGSRRRPVSTSTVRAIRTPVERAQRHPVRPTRQFSRTTTAADRAAVWSTASLSTESGPSSSSR